MEKKSKRSVVIGITVLLLVTLTLVGLTYAYYRTRIIGNSEEKTISVRSEKYELTYVDGDGSFDSGIAPIPLGSKYVKYFAVEDSGEIFDTLLEYNVVLENLTNSFTRDDWTYKLYISDNEYPNLDDEEEDTLISEGKYLIM